LKTAHVGVVVRQGCSPGGGRGGALIVARDGMQGLWLSRKTKRVDV